MGESLGASVGAVSSVPQFGEGEFREVLVFGPPHEACDAVVFSIGDNENRTRMLARSDLSDASLEDVEDQLRSGAEMLQVWTTCGDE